VLNSRLAEFYAIDYALRGEFASAGEHSMIFAYHFVTLEAGMVARMTAARLSIRSRINRLGPYSVEPIGGSARVRGG
jgi:hypothetical protein